MGLRSLDCIRDAGRECPRPAPDMRSEETRDVKTKRRSHRRRKRSRRRLLSAASAGAATLAAPRSLHSSPAFAAAAATAAAASAAATRVTVCRCSCCALSHHCMGDPVRSVFETNVLQIHVLITLDVDVQRVLTMLVQRRRPSASLDQRGLITHDSRSLDATIC